MKSPPKPKPPSPSNQPPKPNLNQHQYELEERRQLQNQLKRYNCSLSEELSEQTRLFGMSQGRHQCQVVHEAVRDYISRERKK